jgi:hypothetical protein
MKNKCTKISLILLLLNVFVAVNLFAQSTPPLVYDKENTGASFPKPVMIDDLNQLPFIQQLPDPFAWADGSGRSTNFADWEKRRNEIKAQIEHYEIGTKPDRPENITATFANNVLTVNVTVNGQTLTLTSNIILPEGNGKFPAIIGINGGSGSLPSNIFTNRNIAQIPFNFSQVMAHQQTRGSEPINKLYPDLIYIGAYSAWSWGISRLIDGIEIALADKIDLSHLAVSGCSFAGKMALFAGAFDERIALTIAQESGGGGYTAWRVSETLGAVENLGSTDYHWFIEDMRKFAGNNVPKLPIDHHELMAMVAPRALLVTGNEGWEWLADRSGYVASRATQKIYETFDIGDRFGLVNFGGHMHCDLPATEVPAVSAFVDKFLLGDQTANTNIFEHPYATYNYKFWMSDWSGEVNPDGALEETWREAESDCVTIGSDFSIVDDATASNGKYVTTATSYNNAAPGKEGLITIPFLTKDNGKFSFYVRLNATNASYWVSIDNRTFKKVEGLSTDGAWQWFSIASGDLLAGNHTLAIGAATAGAKLDRIYITNGTTAPTGTGGTESDCLKQVSSTIFDFEVGNLDGWSKKNNGNGITITQEDKQGGVYAMKIVNGTGTDYWSSQIETPIVDIVSGHTYKVSFWARAVGGGAIGRISTQNSNQLSGQYWSDFTVPDEWTQIVYDNLTASGSTVGLDFDMGKTPGKTIYIDDIVIEDKDAKTAIVPVHNTINGYSLEQNYPNPFTGTTNISFETKNKNYVSLKVYNVTGVEVAELAGKEYTQGKHSVKFDSNNLSKGIYFYVLKADNVSVSKKMIIK